MPRPESHDLDDAWFAEPAFPDALHEARETTVRRLREALSSCDDETTVALWRDLDPARRRSLLTTTVLSDFALETLAHEPARLGALLEHGELDAALPREALEALLTELLNAADDEAALHAELRRFRQRRMLGIVWRDLNGGDMWQTAAAVSTLAEVCVEGALVWLERHFAKRWGAPQPRENGEAQRLVVLGMGKLGAGELNLSSDIDLIFAFPEKGTSQNGERQYDHQQYFTKLGQKLIAALDEITADGFVFRVDMRLRPLGDGGPLVGSFNTLDAYYQDQGREWERYAMLKARPIAGDIAAGQALLDSLKPFIYRKYLDFGAIASLREMKSMIHREVTRLGRDDNIKLGRGGIREVEFVVQAFQLIRGGRDTELQVSSLRRAMRCLIELELLPQAVVDELSDDYVFLRNLEHALQAQHDRQTQQLPADDTDRARLAMALDFDDWAALTTALAEARARVRHHFDAVVADPEESDDEAPENGARDSGGDESAADARERALMHWGQLWRGELDESTGEQLLVDAGFTLPESSRRLGAFRDSRGVRGMQRIGYERLEAVMPLLLQAAAESDSPGLALERVLPLIEAVLRRTAYLSLLRENPRVLPALLKLCSASPWIAEQLARHPILLDELLTPATLYSPADKGQLADELRQALARVPEDDDEGLLEVLRVFKQTQVLRVAASDVAGGRVLMKVSDYLTAIAEVVLESVLQMAWRSLTARYGRPAPRDGERDAAFTIVGYGKLGGIELGYGSDLDVVFLYDAAPRGVTDGAKSIDNMVFFTRLGQRIIHLLTATTPSGTLYEVDLRLRPSGSAGLLVSSLEAFAEYQRREAWTWEHQALVRARPVAGDTALGERFEAVRAEILGQRRDDEALRRAVIEMRAKMRDHLGSGKEARAEGRFHLKQDDGGLVDIEFMNQYAVLALSHETPALLKFTDNMRILDVLAERARLPEDEARDLQAAYLAYRDATHRAALAKSGGLVDERTFATHRQRVRELWDKWMRSA
ncbi:bifunctional [glutamate--ammonia ligase]-adenylyl-L-tyrosine phosphorylase/[glutamate--ammonia-ligase] adenylyltransferase [Salinicola aestuarinus]|uniref:bifunctional [glutamate--ammonia ligase]-adenylyl-L-tyrosine phosphorylase/[glutamate--ammonia-ligase] adenylyltransferase n=1 Tax=Salinicola aestuarinus TaxID=1949082 RepID=UPI000DA1916D|nr:bifunctional [glutamate--ammonia ligase]-adenylyl-L-tyrosine phosphorylase/[glutamate--ammonia-ligase] adenylyltransferase [Salinicola aestuarinus]